MKKNKTQAVAIHYDGLSYPKVTAKGEGLIAREIIARAKEHGIPLEQNPELTELLSKVRLNEDIPKTLFMAVAQILYFLYDKDSINKEL